MTSETPAEHTAVNPTTDDGQQQHGEGKYPDCYLLAHAITKKMNLGSLMRTCVAFNVKELIVTTGVDKKVSVMNFGSKGTHRYLKTKKMENMRSAVTYLKERNVTLCGIEITSDAIPITDPNVFKGKGSICFVPGNEGSGLDESVKKHMDFFVYIPQYGNGTACLNVATATAIVLQHFAAQAGYPELEREKDRDKFVMVEPPRFDPSMLDEDEEVQEKRRQRAAKRAQALTESTGNCEKGSDASLPDIGDKRERESDDSEQ